MLSLRPASYLGDALVDFIGCLFAGITILFLEQASQDIELASGSIQIIVG